MFLVEGEWFGRYFRMVVGVRRRCYPKRGVSADDATFLAPTASAALRKQQDLSRVLLRRSRVWVALRAYIVFPPADIAAAGRKSSSERKQVGYSWNGAFAVFGCGWDGMRDVGCLAVIGRRS